MYSESGDSGRLLSLISFLRALHFIDCSAHDFFNGRLLLSHLFQFLFSSTLDSK